MERGSPTLRFNDSGESIKNHEYFQEFEAKFKKRSDTRWSQFNKNEVKNLVGLSFKLGLSCFR
jgi:hypothetical protein